jgi:hypothetical protein
MISGGAGCEEGNEFESIGAKARGTRLRQLAEKLERLPSYMWVLVICCGAGLFSVARGPDNYWDLLYYHLYAPWAYLHHRYLYDVGPAQAQGFFNPTADFLFYSMISSKLNDFPRVIAFIMGAVHGINAALVLAIACHILRPVGAVERLVLRGSALAMGVSGAGFISLLGVTSNDLMNSIFILASLLCLLELAERAGERRAWRGLALSGLLAGIGVGLKYTVVVFLPGLGLIALVIAWRAKSVVAPIAFGVAVVLGFLAAAGHHLLTLWQTFGNPTFPFLNNIFHSPYYDSTSLLDTQFMPRDLWQFLFYPFYWTKTNSYVVTELPFRDWRGAIAYLAIISGLLAFGIRALRPARHRDGLDRETRGLALLFIFLVVSYLVWESMFGNLRYGVTLELLTGVASMGALIWIFDDGRWRIIVAMVLLATLAATTITIDWGHRPYGEKYIDVRVPPLPPKSEVLVATWDAVSYFIPFSEPTAHYLGIENNYLSLTQHNKLAEAVKQGMRTSGVTKFVLSVGEFDSEKLNDLLQHFDLKLGAGPCLPIQSNLEGTALSLCPTETMSASPPISAFPH